MPVLLACRSAVRRAPAWWSRQSRCRRNRLRPRIGADDVGENDSGGGAVGAFDRAARSACASGSALVRSSDRMTFGILSGTATGVWRRMIAGPVRFVGAGGGMRATGGGAGGVVGQREVGGCHVRPRGRRVDAVVLVDRLGQRRLGAEHVAERARSVGATEIGEVGFGRNPRRTRTPVTRSGARPRDRSRCDRGRRRRRGEAARPRGSAWVAATARSRRRAPAMPSAARRPVRHPRGHRGARRTWRPTRRDRPTGRRCRETAWALSACPVASSQPRERDA